MALYPHAKLLLIPPGSSDPTEEMRATVLHVDAGNADSLYHLFENDGGIESHFFVTKRPDPKRPGYTVVEQYRDTKYQADAAFKSNGFAVQVETQGYGTGEWTPEQFRTIQDLLLWIHAEHPKMPLAKIPTDDGAGVGYHSLFESWNLSNHSCPGPDRIRQFDHELVPWLATAGTPPAPADVPHVEVARKHFERALKRLDSGVAEVALAGPDRVVAHACAALIADLASQLKDILGRFPRK